MERIRDRRLVTFDTAPDVSGVAELFAMAAALENAAARRYRQLAERMDGLGEGELAALFRRLEDMETGHEEGLGAWAAREGVSTAQDVDFDWDITEGITEDDIASAGGAASLSPWKALALAVHNEERAFAFYARVAATAGDPTVQGFAEQMADEELSHVTLLRLERRRAWRRAHGGSGPARPGIGAKALTAWIGRRERAAASRHRELAALATQAGERRLADLLDRLASEADPPRPPDGRPTEWLRGEIRRLGDDYNALVEIAEAGGDDETAALADAAARRLTARLAQLRDAEETLSRPDAPRHTDGHSHEAVAAPRAR